MEAPSFGQIKLSLIFRDGLMTRLETEIAKSILLQN
jgi:hypothetical protein